MKQKAGRVQSAAKRNALQMLALSGVIRPMHVGVRYTVPADSLETTEESSRVPETNTRPLPSGSLWRSLGRLRATLRRAFASEESLHHS